MMARLTALVLCLTVPLSEIGPAISYAATAAGTTSPIPQARANYGETLAIPETMAEIRDGQAMILPEDKPVIFLIEDAHNQFHAQQSIEKLLHFLSENHGVETIFLEGGLPNRISPDLLRFFNDETLNMKIGERLLREGEIGGAELFLLKSGRGVTAYGIENPFLYKKNLRSFQNVYAAKQTASALLRHVERKLNTLVPRFRRPVLQKLLKVWVRLQRSRAYMEGYLEMLKNLAEDHLDLNLSDPVNQNAYPQLVRYSKLREIEKNTSINADNNKAFKSERIALLNWLDENHFPKQIIETFQSLLENRSGNNAVRDIRGFLEAFYEQARRKKFDFAEYPAATATLGKLVIQQEIKALDFSRETNALTEQLFSRLTETGEEKKLLTLYTDFGILKSLLALELTKEAWGKVKERPNRFLPSAFQRRLGDKFDTARAGNQLDALFNEALRFYDLAGDRDTAIFENVSARLRQSGVQKSALVTGGFHTGGLKGLFEKRGIAVLEITPRITEVGPNKNYLRQMLPGSRAHTMLKPVSPAAIPLPVIRRLLGEDVFTFHRNRLLGAVSAETRWLQALPPPGPGLKEQGIALNEIAAAGFGTTHSDGEKEPGGTLTPHRARKWFYPGNIVSKTIARLAYIAFLNFLAIPLTVALPIFILESPLGALPADTKSYIVVSLALIPLIEIGTFSLRNLAREKYRIRILMLRLKVWASEKIPTFLPAIKGLFKLRNVLIPLAVLLLLEATETHVPFWPVVWSALFLISVAPLIYLDKTVEKRLPAIRLFKNPLINYLWRMIEKIPFVFLHFEWVKFYYVPWFFLIWPWSIELEGNRTLEVHGLPGSSAAKAALKSTAEGLPFPNEHPSLFFHPWYPHTSTPHRGLYSPWFKQTKLTSYFSLPAGKPEYNTIAHETGHQMYFASWFQKWRVMWGEAYAEYKKDTKGFIISPYSLQDELEGFAEWFVEFYRNAPYRLTADFLNRSDKSQQKMWLAAARAFIEHRDGIPYLKVNFPETDTRFLIPVSLDQEGGITLDELADAIKEARRRQMEFISGSTNIPKSLLSLKELLTSVNIEAEAPLFARLLSWAKLIDRTTLSEIEPDESRLTQTLTEIVLSQPGSKASALAIELLGKIGNEEAIDTLGKLLVREYEEKGEKHVELNKRAVLILKESGGRAAKQALSSALTRLLEKRTSTSDGSPERLRLDDDVVFIVFTRYRLSEEDAEQVRQIHSRYPDPIFRNNNVGNLADQYLREIESKRGAKKENGNSGFGITAGTETIFAVARAVTGGILRVGQAREKTPVPTTEAQTALPLPAEVPQRNDLLLFKNHADAENLPLRISVGFTKTPLPEDPSLGVLINLLARNQLAQVRIEVPDVPNYRWLEAQVREAVLDLRKELGVENRNVALRLTNNPLSLKKFAGDQYVKTLVYDTRREVLESLSDAHHVFLVENDIQASAPLDLEALALLNALDQLLTQNAAPQGIRKALDLLRLSENLSIRLRAESLFKEAA
ncbi:MAG: hypothetical protein HY587_03760 [Candidatus Omnitrophica bacterium]|nr:hypothetical protein [Candidatus Omnitrophota bacterium]